jgi:hypothetical protein
MSKPRSDEETDKLNVEQLNRALADTKSFHALQDGKDPLEAWGALLDVRD